MNIDEYMGRADEEILQKAKDVQAYCKTHLCTSECVFYRISHCAFQSYGSAKNWELENGRDKRFK